MDFRDELSNVELFQVPSSTDDPTIEDKIAAAVDLVEIGPTTDDRALGIQRLGQLGARFDIVEAACRSKSVVIRRAASLALSGFGDEVEDTLVRRLAADPVARVRGAAMSALGQLGRPDLLDLTLDTATDPNESVSVRGAALVAAARLANAAGREDEVIDEAIEFDEEYPGYDCLPRALSFIAGQRSADELAVLLEKAVTGGAEPRLARSIVAGFRSHVPDERVRALLVVALDALPGARSTAAAILADHPDPSARAALERLLQDPSPRDQSQALRALSALGLEQSTGAIGGLLDRDDSVSKRLVDELARVQGGELVLEERARTGRVLRPEALRSLARRSPEVARAVADDLIDDTNALVRLESYVTLAMLTERDVTAVVELDPVPWMVQRFSERLAASRNESQSDHRVDGQVPINTVSDVRR